VCLPVPLLVVLVLFLFERPSSLRKAHDSISDPKYDSMRTSRKQLEEEEEGVEWEGDASEEVDPNLSQQNAKGNLGGPPLSDDNSVDTNAQHVPETESNGRDEHMASHIDEEPTPELSLSKEPTELDTELSSTLRRKREQDYEKGKAVLRQIVLVPPSTSSIALS
jgi:protein AATF/BFR2